MGKTKREEYAHFAAKNWVTNSAVQNAMPITLPQEERA
jgi:hypothetical protein